VKPEHRKAHAQQQDGGRDEENGLDRNVRLPDRVGSPSSGSAD
jgi:hypothetical protein